MRAKTIVETILGLLAVGREILRYSALAGFILFITGVMPKQIFIKLVYFASIYFILLGFIWFLFSLIFGRAEKSDEKGKQSVRGASPGNGGQNPDT